MLKSVLANWSLLKGKFLGATDEEISEKYELVLEMDGITNDDISEIFLMLSSKFDSTFSVVAKPMNDDIKDFAAENKVRIISDPPSKFLCPLSRQDFNYTPH